MLHLYIYFFANLHIQLLVRGFKDYFISVTNVLPSNQVNHSEECVFIFFFPMSQLWGRRTILPLSRGFYHSLRNAMTRKRLLSGPPRSHPWLHNVLFVCSRITRHGPSGTENDRCFIYTGKRHQMWFSIATSHRCICCSLIFFIYFEFYFTVNWKLNYGYLNWCLCCSGPLLICSRNV